MTTVTLSSMTLHQAIEQLLDQAGRRITANEIADSLNKISGTLKATNQLLNQIKLLQE
jgi:hypothetical protein